MSKSNRAFQQVNNRLICLKKWSTKFSNPIELYFQHKCEVFRKQDQAIKYSLNMQLKTPEHHLVKKTGQTSILVCSNELSELEAAVVSSSKLDLTCNPTGLKFASKRRAKKPYFQHNKFRIMAFFCEKYTTKSIHQLLIITHKAKRK